MVGSCASISSGKRNIIIDTKASVRILEIGSKNLSLAGQNAFFGKNGNKEVWSVRLYDNFQVVYELLDWASLLRFVAGLGLTV